MSRPAREKFASRGQTYFVTSQTAERRALFRNERWAVLMQETLQRYQGDSYLMHTYVIMPNHFHLLITPQEALERCVQKIKGGFSFRAKADFGWKFNIWQSGFSDHRIRDAEDCSIHLYYIRHNPIKAGVCLPSEEYPYLRAEVDPIPQRLKPVFTDGVYGGAEAPPLQKPIRSVSGEEQLQPIQRTTETLSVQKPIRSASGEEQLQPIQRTTEALSLQKPIRSVSGEEWVLPIKRKG